MRKLLIVLFAVLLMAPAAAFAAGGAFTDDDDSVFEDDIEWLAGAGVTLGCNPPTNDRYCPENNVSRGQMAAFLRRFAAFLGAEDGIVDQATFAELSGVAQAADFAAEAGDADQLDGLSSEAFIQHGEIVLSHSTSELTAHAFGGPSSIVYANGGNQVSGDGNVIVNLTGPAVLGGVDYGLKSIEYCLQEVSGGANVDNIQVNTNTPIGSPINDATVRTADGCYEVTANLTGAQAYDVYFSFGGGGSLRLSGVQSTWAPAATLPIMVVAPDGTSGSASSAGQ